MLLSEPFESCGTLVSVKICKRTPSGLSFYAFKLLTFLEQFHIKVFELYFASIVISITKRI
jgi:hypothetical protein